MKRYGVDWINDEVDGAPFVAMYDPHFTSGPYTLAEAKAEVIGYWVNQREQAKAMIGQTRRLTASDIGQPSTMESENSEVHSD